MKKCKDIWCNECGKSQVHEHYGSHGDYEGFGPACIIIAIGSIGISETMCRDHYWKCTKCDNVQKYNW